MLKIDKTLIKNNFQKSIETYDKYAFAQKIMARNLINLICCNDFKNILEIGAYSGLFTKIAFEKLNFSNYLALDIVDVSKYLSKISQNINFINCDVENFKTDEKFDLIVANASLQWCADFNSTVKKLRTFLNKDGKIAVSIFSKENLFELKDIFGVGLDYYSIDEIKNMFSKNAEIIQDKIPLRFSSSIDILKHLKYTGVNSIKKNNFTYKELKQRLSLMKEKYNNTITYYPIYIID